MALSSQPENQQHLPSPSPILSLWGSLRDPGRLLTLLVTASLLFGIAGCSFFNKLESIFAVDPENNRRLSAVGNGSVTYTTSSGSPATCSGGKTCIPDESSSPRVPTNPDFMGWDCDDDPDIDRTERTISSSGAGFRCAAVFNEAYSLTMDLVGDGGWVQMDPSSLDSVCHKSTTIDGVRTLADNGDLCGCGAAGCRLQAPAGTTVQLIDHPMTSFFVGWGGDPDCTDEMVTLDAHKTCFATFDFPDLTVHVTGNGWVYGAGGLNCTEATSPCTTELPLNLQTELIAQPSIGAEFLGWAGDCQANPTNPFAATVQMSGNQSCMGNFQGGLTLGNPGVVELVSVEDNGGDLLYAVNVFASTRITGGLDLSGDGRTAVFRGRIAGTPGSDPQTYYARDVVGNHTAAVAQDLAVRAGSSQVAVSADGRYVAFTSADPSLPINNGPTGFNLSRVFVKDLVTNEIQPVSVDDPANNIEIRDQVGFDPAISGNGRYVAFIGRMIRRPDPLSPPINESNFTVLVRDTCAGVPQCMPNTHVVSVNNEGVRPIDPNSTALVMEDVSLSADGRFVAFNSNSDLLHGVQGTGTDAYRHVFLHDRDADEDNIFDEPQPADPADPNPISTQLVSDFFTPSPGGALAQNTEVPVISANGRYIVYKQNDPNQVAHYGSATLVYDSCYGAPAGTCNPSIVGVPGSGTSNDALNENPDISGDGRFISMSSIVSNVFGVAVRDTCAGVMACTPETRLVSINRFGNPAQAGSGRISADGQAVAFASSISNLLAIGTGTLPDVFLAQTGFNPTLGDQPTLDQFLPSGSSSHLIGHARRLFTLVGQGFVPGSTVLLNGVPRRTIYVSSQRVEFRLTDAEVATPITYEVAVANPSGHISNPLSLVVF